MTLINRNKVVSTFVAVSLLLVSIPVRALTLVSLNLEWYWDGLPPHEGQIAIGPAGSPPSAKQVELEAYAVAQHINYLNADIVGLVEVEGRAAVGRIVPYLDGDWHVVFKQGRDTYTGQDVALLTRLAVIDNTETTFAEITGQFNSTHARPSKVLGVGLRDENGTTYYVIVAHLISKRASNDNKRAAQANAVAQAVMQQTPIFDHVIVMGDLNDTLGSATLDELLSRGLVAVSNPNDFSYVHDGNHELIDHILLSTSLVESSADFSAFDLGPISDHRGVRVILP